MYWTISQFPELQALETPERNAILSRLAFGTYYALISRSAFFALVVSLLLALFASLALNLRWDPIGGGLGWACCGGCTRTGRRGRGRFRGRFLRMCCRGRVG